MDCLIVRCPNCGNRFATASKARAKCRYCGRTFTPNPKRRPSRVLASLPDPRMARTALLGRM